MKKKFSLSFVFPMYNEVDNIESCVQGAMSIGKKLGIDYEIVVVDDASTDGCGEIADKLAATFHELKVIHHKTNRKLGGTLKTGFFNATKDYILYMDSDLPLNFDDVCKAIPQIADADMLIGYRLTRDESFRRKFISKVYNLLIRLVFGLKARDINFSFKLFKREILQRVSLRAEGSFIDAELLIETFKSGYKIDQIGLYYYPRIAGESTLASNAVIRKILVEMWQYYNQQKNSIPNRTTSLHHDV